MLLSPLYRWRNRSLEWFLHHLPEVTRLSSSRIDFSDSGIQELTVLTHLERKDWLESSFYLPLMPVHSFCHHLSFFFPCFFTGGWLQNLIPRPFFFFSSQSSGKRIEKVLQDLYPGAWPYRQDLGPKGALQYLRPKSWQERKSWKLIFYGDRR